MKYFSLIATIVISTLFILTGCEKCRTCSYTYTDSGEEKIYRSQVCGNGDDIEAFENSVSEAAASLQAVYTCIDE